MLVLYVTMLGAAVGVRDAGHIGMESLLVLVPERVRQQARDRSSTCWSALFGALMACNGCAARDSVMDYKIPTLGMPEGINYVPVVIAGALIVLFSIEHIIALLARRREVEPAWH